MKYIDIHCHLDFKDYDSDREEVLARMKENEVGAITIGTDLESSKQAVKIAEENENIWACIGIHPEMAGLPSLNIREGLGGELSELVQNPKVVAIGECGLDYFRIKEESEKEIQKALFRAQIEFALKYDKPLMLHCRNAYEEVLEILNEYKGARGNCHFFAGTTEQAKRFLDLGFTMSFTGVVTFSNDYDEVIRYLPTDSIMSETDAPFVSPIPYRGKRNEPAYVVEVVKKMAILKNVSTEEMAKTIHLTASRVFGLSPNS